MTHSLVSFLEKAVHASLNNNFLTANVPPASAYNARLLPVLRANHGQHAAQVSASKEQDYVLAKDTAQVDDGPGISVSFFVNGEADPDALGNCEFGYVSHSSGFDQLTGANLFVQICAVLRAQSKSGMPSH
eukprot:SAG31_NODE_1670_length_7567_cov_13.084360_8_plen_131_part_00